MEAEYQNSVLPDCHDGDDRHPQDRIELGEQFLSPGNVPEEAVDASALGGSCIPFFRINNGFVAFLDVVLLVFALVDLGGFRKVVYGEAFLVETDC